jgi:hypothetical protein
MKLTKKDLIHIVETKLNEMPMDFDSPDRPDQEIQNKLSTGDTPLKKVPLPKTGQEPNKNFQELLASERYKQVIQKVRQFTGNNQPIRGVQGMMPLMQEMMIAHNTIVQLEREHRRELEQLAIEVVMKEMGIPEGAIEFDAKIVGMDEITGEDFNHDQDDENPEAPDIDAPEIEIEQRLFNQLETLNVEKAKRRLINNLIQGASKRGHYMFQLVPERIQQITGSDQLFDLYGIMMSVNDLMYWQLSDETVNGSLQNSIAGKEQAEGPDEEGGPGKVFARGINFPVLVHELIKGTMELMALQGKAEDDWEDIEESEDTLEKELWDLRLGPAIWDRFRSKFPDEIFTDENKIHLQNYLISAIFKLPARKFLVFMREVLGNTNKGEELMNELMDGINQAFQDNEYDEAMQQFDMDLDDANETTTDDDMMDFLKDLGIEGIKDDDETTDDDDEIKLD